jgi:sigma-B regulation protein RsbU (phosphoserine phosphatase)
LAASSSPCRSIGGDFLDYFDVPDGAFGFVLGDVAGKGPPAALLAAQVQGLVAAYARTSRGPADTFALVNEELVRRHVESRFATLFYGVLSVDGRVTYCNAGHNPPLIVGSAIRRLDAGGVPVGLFKGAVFHEDTVQLDPTDLLVVFSDGVVEALDGDGAEFGESRLLSAVTIHRDAPPAALLEQIMSSVRTFAVGAEQHDDITALVLRYDDVVANTTDEPR